jgi:hypothetical protein
MSTQPIANGRSNGGLPPASSLADVRQDVAESLVDQGYSLAAARTAADGAAGSTFSEVFRSALERVTEQRRTNGARLSGLTAGPAVTSAAPANHKPVERATKATKATTTEATGKTIRETKAALRETKPSASETKCGCGRPRSHRGPCQFRRDQARAKALPLPVPEKNSSPETSERNSDPAPLATLHVNEDQLNRFLTGLPLAEKERLAQQWLSGEQS